MERSSLKSKFYAITLLTAGILTTLAGCAMTNSEEPNGTKPAGTRSVDDVDSETKKISSEILDIIAVKGKLSEPGPGVSACEGDERGEETFMLRHPWSLTASSDGELSKAMARLKEELPKNGWEIVKYGRNNSASKSLTLTADHKERKFGVHVEHWEKNSGGDSNPASLVVTVVSACYQVPDGETVKRY